MKVRLDAIAFDAGTQIRAAINEEVVAQYAEQMTDGAQFPPVVLFHDGNQHYLADGFHRFMAAQRNGWREIEADIQAGTKSDALWFALGANKTNGVRLTHADKRRAALIAIEMWPERSASAIAEQIGVHQTFISDLKRAADVKSALPEKVLGRDGKSYPSQGHNKVSSEREREVIVRLKEGDGVAAIANSLSMSTRTVQKIRERAGIPQRLDRSREGISLRREQMRSMAAEGYSSKQIAAELGLSEEGCRSSLRSEGIDVPADRTIGKAKRHDANRIIEQIVADAENLTEGVGLIDFADVDKSRLAEWLKSLTASRDKFGGFIRRLMKEQQKHGEAA